MPIKINTENRRHYLIGDTYPVRDALREAGAHWVLTGVPGGPENGTWPCVWPSRPTRSPASALPPTLSGRASRPPTAAGIGRQANIEDFAMNASTYHRLINDLLAYEIDGKNPSDGRRIVRDERMTLMVLQKIGENITDRAAEARRVLEMWS